MDDIDEEVIDYKYDTEYDIIIDKPVNDSNIEDIEQFNKTMIKIKKRI